MSENIFSFGTIVATARKNKGLKLRECTSRIIKDDMKPISVQYLSDIENDRRNAPPEYILEQMASVLGVPLEVLCYYGGVLPKNYIKAVDQETIVDAFRAFSAVINEAADR